MAHRLILLAAPAIARVVWHAGSSGRAQARAYALARSAGKIAGLMGGRSEDELCSAQAVVMNTLIGSFCCIQPGFPLDIELVGEAALAEQGQNRHGVLLVTVHTKLALAVDAAMRRSGNVPLVVGIPQENMRANSWGGADLIDTIDSRSPAILLKMRTALENGRTVVAFVDFRTSGMGPIFISPNLFDWADSTRVPIVYMLSSQGRRGEIRLEFAREPTGITGGESKTRSFVEFLEKRTPSHFEVCRPKHAQAA